MQEHAGFTELAKLHPPASSVESLHKLVSEGQTLANYTNKMSGYITNYNAREIRALVLLGDKVQRTIRSTSKHAGLVECERFA